MVLPLSRLEVKLSWGSTWTLDSCLRDHALVAQRQYTARSFVLVDNYERWGFKPVDDDPASRLFIRTRDALASFPADYGAPPDR